jgi:hypothetical protein
MAGTTGKSSTPVWVSLFAAYARARAHYPGQAIPALTIKSGIEAGQVRIRAWHYEGRVAGDPNIDALVFWQGNPGPLCNWERSTVRRRCGGWEGKGYAAHAVEVVQEDIDDLIAAWGPLPAELLPAPIPAPPLHGTKRWIFDLLRHHPDADGRWIWEQRPDEAMGIKLKTVQNLATDCRKQLGLSRKIPKSSRER